MRNIKITFLLIIIFFCFSCKNDERDKVLLYSNGGLKETYNLNEQNKREGLTKKYYPNGKLKALIIYKNGVIVDSSMFFDEAERLLRKQFFFSDSIITETYDVYGKVKAKDILWKKDRFQNWFKSQNFIDSTSIVTQQLFVDDSTSYENQRLRYQKDSLILGESYFFNIIFGNQVKGESLKALIIDFYFYQVENEIGRNINLHVFDDFNKAFYKRVLNENPIYPIEKEAGKASFYLEVNPKKDSLYGIIENKVFVKEKDSVRIIDKLIYMKEPLSKKNR